MVENYLLQIGMKCGTVKNFNSSIQDDLRLGSGKHWYFLTPIKATEKGTGLKEATISMAFPFVAERGDVSEQVVIERLSKIMPEYETELLTALRKDRRLIVPSYTFTIIPFWANEKASERNERKDFATRIHIINAAIVVKYREYKLNSICN